jgi:hypothetical protein
MNGFVAGVVASVLYRIGGLTEKGVLNGWLD